LKKVYLIVFISVLFILSCEDKNSTTPFKVIITSPTNGSTVSEIIAVTCSTTNNESVDKLELWVNGVSTGISDDTEPYSLDWNTNTYEDTSYSIIVRSYDDTRNLNFSDPITLLVDNSGSYPTTVELYTVSSKDSSFNIYWSQNVDDDYYSYKLYESLSKNMSSKSMIYETFIREDTTYKITGIGRNEIKYYQVVVEDIYEFETISNIEAGYSKLTFFMHYGGRNGRGNCVEQTTDRGYVIVGSELFKTDSQGNEEWINESISGQSVQQTTDGGYIIVGQTWFNGDGDVLLVKTDSQGNEEWNQIFGRSNNDHGESVQQTNDGGYIITGGENQSSREGDIWLIKTDSKGNEEWNQVFGENEYDWGNSVQQTSDGGYIVTGLTDIRTNNNVTFDVRFIKTDSKGIREWDRFFGVVDGDDGGNSGQQTTDGGYIITGNHGFGGVWLIKTNSKGIEEWNKIFSFRDGYGSSVKQTTDLGYIITGSYENGMLLIKTDSEGNW